MLFDLGELDDQAVGSDTPRIRQGRYASQRRVIAQRVGAEVCGADFFRDCVGVVVGLIHLGLVCVDEHTVFELVIGS